MAGLDFNSRCTLSDHFVGLIDKALEERSEKPRAYLGGSAIGEPCARRIQYNYLGQTVDPGAGISGRTRRIFRRGHEGEEWMVEWIRAAGFDLRTGPKAGGQYGFEDCEGRFKGHVDGVIVSGPENFAYPALWENKVLGSKGFNKLKRHGLSKAYPVYAAQVATYQAYMQLADHPAFFTAVCADTMEIELFLVPFDQQLAQHAADKAASILSACDHGETLPRGSSDPDGFVCRFCPYKGSCWSE